MESSRVACLEGVKGLVKLARDMAKSAGAPQLYKKTELGDQECRRSDQECTA